MKTFQLYRFIHSDGTAKDWAYADLGNGHAEIRWGSANHLNRSQLKPLQEAEQRAQAKLRKGYTYVCDITLDAKGNTPRGTSAGATPATKPAPKPIDLKALLGSGDGFYF
ncbi:hypothetical protein CKO31_07820 [Thiohalocapsa halophila]|uniref:WGR domain-containing protein n=1 Tax=Thiohalocapsa halophila TaxID=69359 RepID=A0ABS1CFH1_9GAMM|nr:hypothetical protein [Thiohalocapsa halophila]MBK1630652.1 hypothetical protein [Thiohalocapsa halophila]